MLLDVLADEFHFIGWTSAECDHEVVVGFLCGVVDAFEDFNEEAIVKIGEDDA